ncbi:MAG: hypothetical protein MAG795_01191 [Candidatus Woesearchaeota archaeon]|nr:hypothetical protein [Candidatus Woesearchaeota archaeon]
MKLNKKLLYVAIFSISWAFVITINKHGLNLGTKPFQYTAQTNFITAIILSLLVFFTKKQEFAKIDKNLILKMIAIGLCVGIAYITGIYGLKLTSSINYGFVIKSAMIFTIIQAYIFLKEKLTKQKILLLIVFTIGAYLVTTAGKLLIPKPGDLLTMVAALGFSSANIIQKKLTKEIDPVLITWARITFAFLTVAIASLVIGKNIFEIIAPVHVIAVGFLSVILVIYLVKTLSVASASYLTMTSMITPFLVTIFGLVFLKETINIFQIIGGILIIGCGVLVHKLDM